MTNGTSVLLIIVAVVIGLSYGSIKTAQENFFSEQGYYQ